MPNQPPLSFALFSPFLISLSPFSVVMAATGNAGLSGGQRRWRASARRRRRRSHPVFPLSFFSFFFFSLPRGVAAGGSGSRRRQRASARRPAEQSGSGRVHGGGCRRRRRAVTKRPGDADAVADMPRRRPGEAVAVHWLRHAMFDAAGDDGAAGGGHGRFMDRCKICRPFVFIDLLRPVPVQASVGECGCGEAAATGERGCGWGAAAPTTPRRSGSSSSVASCAGGAEVGEAKQRGGGRGGRAAPSSGWDRANGRNPSRRRAPCRGLPPVAPALLSAALLPRRLPPAARRTGLLPATEGCAGPLP
nr:uncharacterized protein LOC112936166 [Oryza sativa Japonica Group]